MGAETFYCGATGSTPQEAFNRAVQRANEEEGRGGYTGSIAEKTSFVMIHLPPERDQRDYADQLIDEGDPRIDDKWGPAGCFDLGGGNYVFFGWASS